MRPAQHFLPRAQAGGRCHRENTCRELIAAGTGGCRGRPGRRRCLLSPLPHSHKHQRICGSNHTGTCPQTALYSYYRDSGEGAL